MGCPSASFPLRPRHGASHLLPTLPPLTAASPRLPLHHPAAPGPSARPDTRVGQESSPTSARGAQRVRPAAVAGLRLRLARRAGGDTAQENQQPPMSTASPALCFTFRFKPAPFSFQDLVQQRPVPPAACHCQCPTDWLTPQNSALHQHRGNFLNLSNRSWFCPFPTPLPGRAGGSAQRVLDASTGWQQPHWQQWALAQRSTEVGRC